MERFWQNWLTVWCGAVGLFGLVLAGAAFEATSGPTRLVFTLLRGPGELDFTPHLRFSLALLGAVTLGWSITMLAAVRAANQLGALGSPVWRLLTASIVVWYILDSVLSAATGFPINAVSNTGILAGYLLPVIRSGVLQRH